MKRPKQLMQIELEFGDGRVRVAQSLLGEWINAQLATFLPTARSQRGAGEEVPFSFPKTLAALLMLTHLPLSEIAKHTGTSVGVLKVWRTQERFREQLHCYAREYARHYTQRFQAKRGPDWPEEGTGLYSQETVVAILDEINHRGGPLALAMMDALQRHAAGPEFKAMFGPMIEAASRALFCQVAADCVRKNTRASRSEALQWLGRLEAIFRAELEAAVKPRRPAVEAEPPVEKGPRRSR